LRKERKARLANNKVKVMSLLTNYIRNFNENKFWKRYEKSRKGNKLSKLFYSVLYMRMASKQGGYIGRETTFKGKPHFPHGLHGVHISRIASIGKECTIFQCVTIGQNGKGAPQIGDNCTIGANAVLIGNIKIGDNVSIGAGAIVVNDIPSNSVAISPKATVIEKE